MTIYFYNFILGCSKCHKGFPRIALPNGKQKGNFSGFDRTQWTARDPLTHREHALRSTRANSAAEKRRAEASGVRWTELLCLDYFDPIQHHNIDTMHCFWLGIAKHMTKHFFQSGILSKQNLQSIQEKMNTVRVPSTVGRIPYKIASGFSAFTADQWKNWTLIYSSVVLKGTLPREDYQVWMMFVKAAVFFSKKIVTVEEVNLADRLMVQFCQAVERRYGEAFCTPNMHMACHVAELIRKFGGIHGHWCFSFER